MKHKILMIEDYQPLLGAIEVKMSMLGITTFFARSSSEGLQMLELHPEIELIWLDHHLLGDETGLDFLKKLRGDPRYNALPVIAVSNEGSLEKISEYQSLGVRKYYSKVEATLDEIGKNVVEILGK